jgi:thioredoxin reductase (NADPH)
MKKVAIIGGGPAGCQAALWLHNLGFYPVIIEQKNNLGGLQSINPYINNWMAGVNHLTGYDIAKNIEIHIQQLKLPILFNSIISSVKQKNDGFELIVNQKTILCSFIVIATGVVPCAGDFISNSQVIIGPGTEIDQFDFKNKKVAVFGGGDNAADNYRYIKAKKPQLCHVYARTIRARQNLWCHLDRNDFFLKEYHANQKNMCVMHQNMMRYYDIFVVLYGWQAQIPEALSPFKEQLFNNKNFIEVDANRETKIPGIFAAGEVTHLMHPCVITAMADGVMVAKAIEHQIKIKAP